MSVLALASAGVRAQDIEPRAYANAPVGVNFLVTAVSYAQGGLAVDPSVPLTNANLKVRAAALAYVRTLDLWGQSAKFDLIAPVAAIDGTGELSGQSRERHVTGAADPRLRLSVNFFGSPALSLKDFADYRQDLIAGASVQVSLPMGQYDPDKLINVGTHRAFLKSELGVSKALGSWTLECAVAANWFADNKDFFGGQRREQEPIYAVQGHVIHSFPSGIWLALDGTYYKGGRTSVDGVKGNDLQENSRLGATLALPLDRHHSLKFNLSSGVSTRTGSDFDSLGIAWQYRWGGGL